MEQEKRFKRKVGDRGQVTIPIEFREQFGLTAGEEVVFTVDERGDLLLRKSGNEQDLASAYQRTAQRDKRVNTEWEHVSVEATDEVEPDVFDDESTNQRDTIDANWLSDKGVTTAVDWKDKSSYGRSISPKKSSQMHRLRKWQERIRTKDAGEQNLQFALSEIDRMASALGVPSSVREVASVIYRRALKEDLIRGRSIEGVATSALYAACRKEGIPRSLEEISEVSRVERTEIGRTYRYLSQELELEMRPVDPKKYVPRFCSELELSDEVQTKANEIIEKTAEEGLLSGKSPTGYAAAAIYAASLLCNEMRTRREVADVAQVTEATIQNRYQEQIEAMESIDLEN
uniref:Transcription initiation factor IIB n=1 Tax=Haloterrigena alkaliphila TaxID=2816475 RepID=A0A8A2VBU3_9EURY